MSIFRKWFTKKNDKNAESKKAKSFKQILHTLQKLSNSVVSKERVFEHHTNYLKNFACHSETFNYVKNKRCLLLTNCHLSKGSTITQGEVGRLADSSRRASFNSFSTFFLKVLVFSSFLFQNFVIPSYFFKNLSVAYVCTLLLLAHQFMLFADNRNTL